MTDRPAPLTASGTDLRDFGFMPLDVVRLRDSDLAADAAEVFRAAVLSWCASWHQVPAASLPDDDAALSRLLGYGRDLKGWKRLRAAGGLRGWVLCSDGRLYHPVVAQKANEAWKSKQAQRSRTEAARAALQSKRQSLAPSVTDLSQSPRDRDRDRDRDSKGTGRQATDPGDLFTGATAQPIDATRRVVETDLDHLANAHAIIGREEGGRWQLLVKTHGRDRVIDVVRQVHLSGERAFYSTIRDRLAAPAAADTGVRSPAPAPVQTPEQIATAIVYRDGWEACLQRLPKWIHPRIVGEQSMLLAIEAADGIAVALIAASKGAA